MPRGFPALRPETKVRLAAQHAAERAKRTAEHRAHLVARIAQGGPNAWLFLELLAEHDARQET
jgi:hypothetical protein